MKNRNFIMWVRYFSCVLAVSLATLLINRPVFAQENALIFAAASTNAPLTAVIQSFKEKTGMTVTASFASSSVLATQISQGAPAELFLSANVKWMDYLDAGDFLSPSGRINFLTNRLVLAGNIGRNKDIDGELEKLPDWLGDNRIAVGDPDHVPAGIYAKKALENLGIWPTIKDKFVRQPNVTSALAMVARNEVSYAIVYATDIIRSDNVEIVAVFPEETHPKITYVLAQIRRRENVIANQFREFLLSKEAQTIFGKFGFDPLISP